MLTVVRRARGEPLVLVRKIGAQRPMRQSALDRLAALLHVITYDRERGDRDVSRTPPARSR